MSNALINQLRRLNSKERFFLVGYALDNPAFKLGVNYRRVLSQKLGVEVPENAFCAMDFHLDWIYAALYVVGNPCVETPYKNDLNNIQGKQEDVDLLIAFESDGDTHLVLIEAKATSGWTNSQANSKAKRLHGFFPDKREQNRVVPHFILMSPQQPRLITDNWPAWMKADHSDQPIWIELPIPDDLQKVSRCDEKGHSDAGGGFWQLVER
ncbi:MAG: hypothetical protein R3F04_08055 [Lysobacteraceae bacterium]